MKNIFLLTSLLYTCLATVQAADKDEILSKESIDKSMATTFIKIGTDLPSIAQIDKRYSQAIGVCDPKGFARNILIIYTKKGKECWNLTILPDDKNIKVSAWSEDITFEKGIPTSKTLPKIMITPENDKKSFDIKLDIFNGEEGLTTLSGCEHLVCRTFDMDGNQKANEDYNEFQLDYLAYYARKKDNNI